LEQKVHCDNGDQNSFRELLALFGSSTPDVMGPTVAITYPMDGDTFEPGADFDITADASDDTRVVGVELLVDGASQNTDSEAPYSWTVTGIPAGIYELQAVASDVAGNSTASSTVTITVGESPDTTGTGGGSEGAGSDDAGSQTSGDEGGSTTSVTGSGPSTPDGGDASDSGQGCACKLDARPSSSAAWLFLLFGVARRRLQPTATTPGP
jgi:hypothetical protein